jgi:hypothetical protein
MTGKACGRLLPLDNNDFRHIRVVEDDVAPCMLAVWTQDLPLVEVLGLLYGGDGLLHPGDVHSEFLAIHAPDLYGVHPLLEALPVECSISVHVLPANDSLHLGREGGRDRVRREERRGSRGVQDEGCCFLCMCVAKTRTKLSCWDSR